MDNSKIGMVIGLLFLGFALATLAAAYTVDQWTDTIAVAHWE